MLQASRWLSFAIHRLLVVADQGRYENPEIPFVPSYNPTLLIKCMIRKFGVRTDLILI
jgi:hypothetical protein